MDCQVLWESQGRVHKLPVHLGGALCPLKALSRSPGLRTMLGSLETSLPLSLLMASPIPQTCPFLLPQTPKTPCYADHTFLKPPENWGICRQESRGPHSCLLFTAALRVCAKLEPHPAHTGGLSP